MGNFKKLNVWQKAKALSVEVYRVTSQNSFNKDYSLKDQIRRAAISVPSNIAEGDESGFKKMGIRYLYIAKASLAELESQLIIAREINYIDEKDELLLMELIDYLSRMLRKLIKYRSSL